MTQNDFREGTLAPARTARAPVRVVRPSCDPGTTSPCWSNRNRAVVVTVGFMLLTLTGCSSEDLPTFAMPERGVTDQAPRILSLWQGSWIAALSVGALVWGLILWSVVFHRRKPGDTGLPPQIRYNVPIEVFYTLVPLIMIGVFFFFTARDEDRITRVSASPDHEITVTGIQWSWQFTYASDGDDTTTRTGTPAKPPTLMLPLGESVKFTLVSDDVIHSFWVPAFLFKRDVIPGRSSSFQITPKKLGTYIGRCAELCGQDHARMLFNVKIVPPADYASYVAKLKAEGAQ